MHKQRTRCRSISHAFSNSTWNLGDRNKISFPMVHSSTQKRTRILYLNEEDHQFRCVRFDDSLYVVTVSGTFSFLVPNRSGSRSTPFEAVTWPIQGQRPTVAALRSSELLARQQPPVAREKNNFHDMLKTNEQKPTNNSPNPQPNTDALFSWAECYISSRWTNLVPI